MFGFTHGKNPNYTVKRELLQFSPPLNVYWTGQVFYIMGERYIQMLIVKLKEYGKMLLVGGSKKCNYLWK